MVRFLLLSLSAALAVMSSAHASRADEAAPELAPVGAGAAASSATGAAVDPAFAGPTIASDSFGYQAGGDVMIDSGLLLGFPTALPTGLSRGVAAGVTFGACPLRWGGRAAWVTANESTMAWSVTHSEVRLRVTGSAQHDAGRGSVGLRLGLGGTLVHETRLRNQGARAGLSGSELETSAYALLPAADLEAVVGLHVIGPWLLLLSGGPSAAWVDGGVRGSWTAELGVAWRP